MHTPNAQPMPPAPQLPPKAAEILSWLDAEGYRPTIDDDGDLRIVMFGRRYLIVHRADDDTYIQLVAHRIHTFDESGRDSVIKLASTITASTKVAKCIALNGIVSVIADGRYVDATHFTAVFEELISAVDYAVRGFRAALEEHAAMQAADQAIKRAISG